MGGESQVRLSVFIVLFISLAILEYLSPRRQRSFSRQERWPVNITMSFLNSFLAQLSVAAVPVMAALYVTENNIGLLAFLDLSVLGKALLSYIILDLVIYFQHRVFHAVPVLFKLHMVHHSDQDLDVTSGVRFHVLEILLSLLIKAVFIFIIGANPMGVLMFEVVLSSGSLFNHSNININPRLDRFLRIFIVTPDMHRIHHSTESRELNSNFGFTISWWDFLFRTYQKEPLKGQLHMELGLRESNERGNLDLLKLLKLPFVSK